MTVYYEEEMLVLSEAEEQPIEVLAEDDIVDSEPEDDHELLVFEEPPT